MYEKEYCIRATPGNMFHLHYGTARFANYLLRILSSTVRFLVAICMFFIWYVLRHPCQPEARQFDVDVARGQFSYQPYSYAKKNGIFLLRCFPATEGHRRS